MKEEIHTDEEIKSLLKRDWDKRNEGIMEIAAPIIAQQADGSFRDALNGLQKFMSTGILDFPSVEQIVKVLTPEQIEKARPFLMERGYGNLLSSKD